MGYDLPDDWFVEETGERLILDQKKVAAEIERLRAEQKRVLKQVAALVDNAASISPGCDPSSWGAGFQTAHQMVLNILNRNK